MTNNSFFKPTPLYKEFMILDLIEKNKHITQREISDSIGVAVSMVNSYLDEYEEKGLIKRKYRSTKTVEYFVTKKGIERRKLLNIRYLKSAQEVYLFAKNNITAFLRQIIKRGFQNILLYGAGEVAEIILDVIKNDVEMPLHVIAVVDDDVSKEHKSIHGTEIILPTKIHNYTHDGIFISSYTHRDSIYKKLLSMKYDMQKIIQFFN